MGRRRLTRYGGCPLWGIGIIKHKIAEHKKQEAEHKKKEAEHKKQEADHKKQQAEHKKQQAEQQRINAEREKRISYIKEINNRLERTQTQLLLPTFDPDSLTCFNKLLSLLDNVNTNNTILMTAIQRANDFKWLFDLNDFTDSDDNKIVLIKFYNLLKDYLKCAKIAHIIGQLGLTAAETAAAAGTEAHSSPAKKNPPRFALNDRVACRVRSYDEWKGGTVVNVSSNSTNFEYCKYEVKLDDPGSRVVVVPHDDELIREIKYLKVINYRKKKKLHEKSYKNYMRLEKDIATRIATGLQSKDVSSCKHSDNININKLYTLYTQIYSTFDDQTRPKDELQEIDTKTLLL